MSLLKETWEFLWDIYERAKGTPYENTIPIIFIIVSFIVVVRVVVIPLWKSIRKVCEWISKKWFVKREIYRRLSFMDSSDLYYAIKNYVPTRYSIIDPANNEEPIPEYVAQGGAREPLLVEHFIKYEYNIKNGKKYYLCLGDCGMGKTTFLINLYYQTLKLRKFECVFVSLQEAKCIEQIKKIKVNSKTILLLDALDENESALTNYESFITELENATRQFYRVIITARTNFFESENKEQISNNKSNVSMVGKLSESRKYYIAPFTDDDIKKFLKKKYHFQSNKRKRAWKLVEKNKNLSVRPLLLRFMDDLLEEECDFQYDFQLYESLFKKWIEREKRGIDETLGKGLYDECLLMAKEIYYRWMKDGKIGVYAKDLKEEKSFSGIRTIQLKGHALLNRTSDGMYKFSHRSYWEFLLAKLALRDCMFSDELLIRNFDRATAFLKEMVRYNDKNSTQGSVESSVGKANYLLQYGNPEKAEEQYKYVIENCIQEEPLYLLSLVNLAKCYWQQIKFESARSIFEEIFERISNSEIDENNVVLYSRFAVAYAPCCQTYHIAMGQEILKVLIQFYLKKQNYGYDLLRCYEAYCRSCINYKLKRDAIENMKKLIDEHYEDNQYAKYMYLKAVSWNSRNNSQELFKVLTQINKQYIRFMDFYSQIVKSCDLAICMCAYYKEQNVLEQQQQKVWNQFTIAYDLCGAIYSREKKRDTYNPYDVIIQYKIVQMLSKINDQRANEFAEQILKYVSMYSMKNEMSIFWSRLLKSLADNKIQNVRRSEKYLLMSLRLAKNSTYQMTDICIKLFLLYDKSNREETAQQYLESAYKHITYDSEVKMTPLYCYVLRTVLIYHKGAIDRENIVKELLEITPNIYGTDERQERIYDSLRQYLWEIKDIRVIAVCQQLLSLRISREVIETLFDACEMHSSSEEFIAKITEIIIKKEFLALEDIHELEQFIEEKQDYFYEEDLIHYKRSLTKVKKNRKGL